MNKKEKQAQQLILNEVEKAVTLLHAHMVKYCTDNKVSSIPIDYINGMVLIMMNAYKKGVNENTH